MNLYLIRHADAAPMSEEFATDEERPLTEEGCRQAELLGLALQRLGISLDRIATSPLLRARQTAQGVLNQLCNRRLSAPDRGLNSPRSPELVECEALAPGGSPKKLARYLEESGCGHIALVGHQPDMSEHAAWLIGSRKARIEFVKAAVACIVCEELPAKGAGVLHWLVTPEWYQPQP